MNKKRFGLVLSAALLLSACGGGGDDDSPAPAAQPSQPSAIQGIWGGDSSIVVITPSGEYWSVVVEDGEVFLLRGSATASGSQFSGSITVHLGADTVSGSLTGTFVARNSLSGTMTVDGENAPLNLSYDAVYDQTPSLAAAAGTYATTTGSLAVAAGGNFTHTGSNGCMASGRLTPDSSGKNFYRATVTYGGSPCVPAGASGSGVAVFDGSAAIVSLVVGTAGKVLIGTR